MFTIDIRIWITRETHEAEIFMTYIRENFYCKYHIVHVCIYEGGRVICIRKLFA